MRFSQWLLGERMRRFFERTDRKQSTLFPECLEDRIDENNLFKSSTSLLMNSIWVRLGSMGSHRK
jgi:hypothetical protein